MGDPSDPAHWVLRSNFGLLVSHDRAQSWDWVCEAGVGYQNVEPPIAVLDDGTTLVALPNGVAHGATECAFELGAGIDGYVADVARIAGASEGVAAVAVSVDIDAGISQVWRSLDGGRSFQRYGRALNDLNATTLDVAGDGGNTLYVSGISQATAEVTGVLERSVDGGQTWQRLEVPGASKVSAPYIAAIDARDPDTLYVRLSGTPGKLLASHDGGLHWTNALDFVGPLDGFALSPDGRFALASGRSDGLWRAPTSDLAFERVSCQKLRCLSWTNAGLFACADEFQAGFLVGESADSGASFEPRLYMSCVRGPLACDRESSVARACDASWPSQSEVLGSDCANAGFASHGDCADSSSSSAGASGSAAAGASAQSGVAGAQAALRSGGGCALSTPSQARFTFLVALLPVLGGMTRRRAIRRTRA
ncbi:MAG TPA: hypothetical protein VFK05_00680 [Polyangiaceae bacterium]|nr:hypothetical protein [Polyangiaceae bacterium]